MITIKFSIFPYRNFMVSLNGLGSHQIFLLTLLTSNYGVIIHLNVRLTVLVKRLILKPVWKGERVISPCTFHSKNEMLFWCIKSFPPKLTVIKRGANVKFRASLLHVLESMKWMNKNCLQNTVLQFPLIVFLWFNGRQRMLFDTFSGRLLHRQ